MITYTKVKLKKHSVKSVLLTVTLSLIAFPVVGSAQSGSVQPTPSSLNEVVVTASRIETSQAQVANSITVVSQEDLKNNQYRNVLEALRTVPGVDIVQSGPAGGNASAFLRGANSEHTLVLLDGIELNNPASTNRSFNLANLTLDNIERIEILRGPQSTLYGSDALGGVINIITKRAESGTTAYLSSEAGSYNTFNQNAGASYGSEEIKVSVGIVRQDTGGISAANAKNGNQEQDGYENTSLTGNLLYAPVKELDLSLISRFSRAGTQLDNQGGTKGDDLNRRLANDEVFLASGLKTHLLDDRLSQAITLSYTRHDLSDDNDPDELNPLDLLRSGYQGDLFKIDANNLWKPTDWISVVIGAQTERERASSTFRSDGAFGPFEDNLSGTSARTNGIYTEARLNYGEFASFDAGIRVDDHSVFGSAATYRLAPALYLESGTKVRGTVGNGFKAPSLVQLYSSFGNRDLDAERSVGWDVGIDQEVCGDELLLSGTFFRNNFDNLITFNSSTFVLENIAESYSQGFEFSGKWNPHKTTSLTASYTYTDTEDQQTGASLLRRPQNKGALLAQYRPFEGVEVFARWSVFGGRFDNDFSGSSPGRVRLGAYSLFDLGGSYDITDHVQFFTRIENLFDKEYENVLGYGTYGAAAFGGLRIAL
jgi:vitamin B12 transporter